MESWNYPCSCGKQAQYDPCVSLGRVGEIYFKCSCGDTFKTNSKDSNIIKTFICSNCGGKPVRATEHENLETLCYILGCDSLPEINKELLICECGLTYCTDGEKQVVQEDEKGIKIQKSALQFDHYNVFINNEPKLVCIGERELLKVRILLESLGIPYSFKK